MKLIVLNSILCGYAIVAVSLISIGIGMIAVKMDAIRGSLRV